MSNNRDALHVETNCRALPGSKSKGFADILEGAWPSSTGISDAPILNITSRKAGLCESRTKVPCMLKIVAGSPKPSVDIHNDRPRLLCCWKSQISKVERP
jgi:hypothetical protein